MPLIVSCHRRAASSQRTRPVPKMGGLNTAHVASCVIHPSPQQSTQSRSRSGLSCSAATAHTMFPKAVGIVMKRHPQQKQAHDFLDGKACTPMEYATVQWIAPASVDSDFSIAGTISKVSLAQLQADQPNYRLWPVAHMQAAFHESQAASATAHSAAQVLREFTLLLEARCQG